jgi:hypothetical protein
MEYGGLEVVTRYHTLFDNDTARGYSVLSRQYLGDGTFRITAKALSKIDIEAEMAEREREEEKRIEEALRLEGHILLWFCSHHFSFGQEIRGVYLPETGPRWVYSRSYAVENKNPYRLKFTGVSRSSRGQYRDWLNRFSGDVKRVAPLWLLDDPDLRPAYLAGGDPMGQDARRCL